MNINNKIKNNNDFIIFENENGKYGIDIITRKKCYLLEVNGEIFPISKFLIDSYISIQNNNEYQVNLSVIGITNTCINAPTYEFLIIKFLKKIVRYLQTQEISTANLKKTIYRIKAKSNNIIENK